MKTIKQVELKWKRVLISREEEKIYLQSTSSSKEAVKILRVLLETRVEENLTVLLLDIKNKILGFHIVARGGINSCATLPVDVFRAACIAGSSRIIIAHNHPSGDCSPSQSDIDLTMKVSEAATLLGITLLDSIIIGEDCHFSFCDAGIGPFYRKE